MEEEKKEKKLTTNEKIKEIEDSINDIKLRITLLKPEISHELTQRNREFTNQMQNSINNFFEQAKKQRETLQQDATQIFEKAEFIKEFKIRIHKYIEEEIRVALSEKHLTEVIVTKLQQILKDRLWEIIRVVTEAVVKDTNKRLKQEHQVSKELAYSIDKTIKHTIRNANLCYETDKIIEQKVMEAIKKTTTKIIEQKSIKQIENKKTNEE